MKKYRLLLTVLLSAALLASCAGPAPAPENTPELQGPDQTPQAEATPGQPTAPVAWQEMGTAAPVPVAGTQPPMMEILSASADLDGDGSKEIITVTSNEEKYTAAIVINSDTVHYAEELDTVLYMASAYLADVDASDEYCELFIQGSMFSDDWTTLAYRVVDGQVQRTEFYDSVLGADGSGMIEVESVVDVLGTYAGRCQLALENGFTFDRVTPYTIVYTADGPALRMLTLQKDGLPVQVVKDGTAGEQTTLSAGTRLLLRETDEASYAILEGEDGTLYRVALASNEVDGWGWAIGGVPEGDWFGELLYAG